MPAAVELRTNWDAKSRCCTGRPVGRLGVGWGGGEPSIVEGRLPCRSKPIGSAGTAFPSSGTGSPTGPRMTLAYAPAAA
jgi:hypothetical protein